MFHLVCDILFAIFKIHILAYIDTTWELREGCLTDLQVKDCLHQNGK